MHNPMHIKLKKLEQCLPNLNQFRATVPSLEVATANLMGSHGDKMSIQTDTAAFKTHARMDCSHLPRKGK